MWWDQVQSRLGVSAQQLYWLLLVLQTKLCSSSLLVYFHPSSYTFIYPSIYLSTHPSIPVVLIFLVLPCSYNDHRNPEKYMSKKAVQGCHLKYASYNNIDPSTIKQDRTFTWVSFVGDSVLREVFLAAGRCIPSFPIPLFSLSYLLSWYELNQYHILYLPNYDSSSIDKLHTQERLVPK